MTCRTGAACRRRRRLRGLLRGMCHAVRRAAPSRLAGVQAGRPEGEPSCTPPTRRHLRAHHRHLAVGVAGAGARPGAAPAAADAGRGRRHHPPEAAAHRQRAGAAPARHAQRRRRRDCPRRVRRRPGPGAAPRPADPGGSAPLLSAAGDPHLYDVAIALLDGVGNVVDEAASYAALRAGEHRRQGDQAERRVGVSAPGTGPGLLRRRHHDRAHRRNAAPRHRAEHGGRLQRRPPAPEGVRGALPVPRRPLGLPAVGRVRRLGLPRRRPGRRRAPEAGRRLCHPVAGGAGARLLTPQHRRLVPAQ